MGDEINYDSDNSLENINDYENIDVGPSEEEEDHIDSVRKAVKTWKMRELDKSADKKQDPASFNSLHHFLTAAAQLLIDISNYIKSSQNKDENMKDNLYVAIIQAIGDPNNLSSHERIHIENVLNRDLVELPFTVDPSIINAHAKKGIKANTKFYNEEIRNDNNS